jgi:hypothetical protein
MRPILTTSENGPQMKVNWEKLRHIAYVSLGLAAAFAGVVYQGSLARDQVAPGVTFGVLAGLVLVLWSRWQVINGTANQGDVATIQRVFHSAAALAGLAVPAVVMFSSRYAPGSKAFIAAGYLSTFLGDLSKASGEAPLLSSRAAKAAVVALAIAFPLLAPSRALALGLSSFGGCWDLPGGQIACTRVSGAAFLGQYDVTTGKFGGGLTPGAGYGFSLTSGDPTKSWLEGAMDVYLAAQFGQTSAADGTPIPNNVVVIGVLSFADYVRVGFGPTWIEQPSGPAKAHYLIYFGLGSSFGEETNKATLAAGRKLKAIAIGPMQPNS